MKSLILTFAICLTTVINAQEAPTPQIGVRVALGETVEIGDVSVKFTEVLEDSRCPEGVTCVWAGRVRVLVDISEEGKATIQKEVIIGQTRANESSEKKFFIREGNFIEAFAVTPYPKFDVKTEGYHLLIREGVLD